MAFGGGENSMLRPAMGAIAAIPIRLVLNSIREGETSNSSSTRVTPVQQRRRPHGLPVHHPHLSRRKVSAPPELQPHLAPRTAASHPITAAGAINDGTNSPSEYIINIQPGRSPVIDGLYSGSDSGVTSEYSSWAIPINGLPRLDTSSAEDDHPSTVGSLDDLDNNDLTSQRDKSFTSDSECESIGLGSPPAARKTGMNNPGYVNTEGRPIVLSVGGPPPLLRALTDTNLLSTTPPNANLLPNNQNANNTHQRQRTNSMVLQLNVNNSTTSPCSATSTLAGGRSVSLVSLNHAGINTNPNSNPYPNLASLAHADTQSIYSEIGNPHFNTGYLGTQHIASTMGSQGSLTGLKVMENTGGSMAQVPPSDHQAPLPTPSEKKKQWTIETLVENLSLIYAIFLFTLGVVIYLADTFSGHDSAMAESFNIFLIVVQLLWLGYAHVDVRRYLNMITKAMDEARDRMTGTNENVQLEPTTDGQYQLRINLPEPRKTIPQYYGFTSGRHGGSLYLKIGATVFCFGHLIHTGLNLGQKILYLTADDPAFETCTCTPDVLMSILQPIYAFYQLFFVFKYSNLIINRRKLLSRFGLMHCISASLCFWFYTILQETLHSIFSKKSDSDYGNVTTAVPDITTYKHDDDDSDELFDDDDDAARFARAAKYAGKTLTSTAWNINYGCEKTTELTEMINYTTPYLYPFSIEYNILIVGVWILLWENIGRTERHTHIPSIEVTYEEDNTKGFSSNMIIYVDCHSSNRGLFAGLLMTVATVISIILFFIFTSSQNNIMVGLYVNGYSEIILLLLMGAAGLVAFASVRHLDILTHSVSNVDDILLLLCLPCICLYAFFSIVPAITNGEMIFVIADILQVSQVVLQTALIVDGLRRCSNSSSLQQKKPGREMVTFLVVANVAMWMLETFEIKSDAGNKDKYDFYGKYLWTLLSHCTLPLALFYRFHSSVCLADIWKASYEPEPEH